MSGLGHGSIVECMKSKFYQSHIVDPKCSAEMQRRTDEELADISVDPGLYEACVGDIRRYCRDIRPGEGRVTKCLIDASHSSNVQLDDACRGKLEERQQLWRQVLKDKAPEDLSDLASMVQDSPSKHYFLTMIAVVFVVIFVGGLCCGRVTKRVARELKIK